MPRNENHIAELITEHQRMLYGYILSLVHRSEDAMEVLQETNLVLWQKAEQSSEVEDFRSWACRFAYYQVLAHRKRRARDRLYFDEQLLAKLAEEASTRAAMDELRQRCLRRCLRELSPRSQKLLVMRYDSPGSVQATAEALGRTAAAVSQSLYRIRKALLECIRRGLLVEATS